MQPFAIKQPWITEKSARLTESGQYVFLVPDTTTKNEVRKAVKSIYHVEPVSVNITVIPDKKKGTGARRRVKSGYKKAVVTLKEGQKIDLV